MKNKIVPYTVVKNLHYNISIVSSEPFYRRFWLLLKAPFTYLFQGKFEI
jgi:hypothetical protein